MIHFGGDMDMDFNPRFRNFGHAVRPILESMAKASLTVALRCFTHAKLLQQHAKNRYVTTG